MDSEQKIQRENSELRGKFNPNLEYHQGERINETEESKKLKNPGSKKMQQGLEKGPLYQKEAQDKNSASELDLTPQREGTAREGFSN